MAQVKPLYLAKNMKELNSMSTKNKLGDMNPKVLIRSSEKLYLNAYDSHVEGDQERAYVLLLRYLDVLQAARTSKEYKQNKKHYDALIDKNKFKNALEDAEKLSKELSARYEELDETKMDTTDNSSDDIGIQNLNKEDIDPGGKGVIQCDRLYKLLTTRPNEVLVVDCRRRSHMISSIVDPKKYPQWLPIPQEMIKAGNLTAFMNPNQEKAWSDIKKRGHQKYIVLVDANTATQNSVSTMRRIIEDSAPILVLNGGYNNWYLSYGPLCIGKWTQKDLTEKNDKPIENDIGDFAYPSSDRLVPPKSQTIPAVVDTTPSTPEFSQPVNPPMQNSPMIMPHQMSTQLPPHASYDPIPSNGLLPTLLPVAPSVPIPLELEGRDMLLEHDLHVQPEAVLPSHYFNTKWYYEDNGGIDPYQAYYDCDVMPTAPVIQPQNNYSGLQNNNFESGHLVNQAGMYYPPNQGYSHSQVETYTVNGNHIVYNTVPTLPSQSAMQPLPHAAMTSQGQPEVNPSQPLPPHVPSQPLPPHVSPSQPHPSQTNVAMTSQSQAEANPSQPLPPQANVMTNQGQPEANPSQPLPPQPGPPQSLPSQANVAMTTSIPSKNQNEHIQIPLDPPSASANVPAAATDKDMKTVNEVHNDRLPSSDSNNEVHGDRLPSRDGVKERILLEEREKELEKREKLLKEKESQKTFTEEEIKQMFELRLTEEREEMKLLLQKEREKDKAEIEELKVKTQKEMQEQMEVRLKELSEKYEKERADMLKDQEQMKHYWGIMRQQELSNNKQFVMNQGLPAGWEKRLDRTTGRFYYVDHATKTTHWNPPTSILQYQAEMQRQQTNPPMAITGRGTPHPMPLPQTAKPPEKVPAGSISHPPLSPSPTGGLNPPQPAGASASVSKPTIPAVDRSSKPVSVPSTTVKPISIEVYKQKMSNLLPVTGSPGPGLSGLRNLGNTCFMSSVLQCLFATPPLMHYFVSNRYKTELNVNNPLGSGGLLAEEFFILCRATWVEKFKYMSPIDLKSVIGRVAPYFSGTQQHDSQEFLMYFLDGLHEDLNRVKVKKYIEMPDATGIPDHIAAQQAWEIHRKRNNSIIIDLFYGILRSSIHCLSCGRRRVMFEPFLSLSVPIPSGRSSCSYTDCLKLFTAVEKLSGENKWYCPQCKQHRNAEKTLSVWRLPPVLLLHFKRFKDGKGTSREKINSHISFPLENLAINQCVVGPKPTKPYNLFGISNHIGNMGSGHYTACCKNANDGRFYVFNDEDVKSANTRDLSSSSAYLLFYTCEDFRSLN